MARIALVAIAASVVLLYACGRPSPPETVLDEPTPIAARWDGAERSARWTAAAVSSLDTHGADLVKIVPSDIDLYCPGYARANDEERKAFWVNLVASLSYHESTWRPDVSGGGGRWHGLLQISPATAQGYGCKAQDAAALKNGALNVSCGIRIMAETVPRDGVISQGMRGVAADWGPFHQQKKRQDIMRYTRTLPYCQR